MAARYSALEARREDIGDFPKSLSPAPSFDSGTLYSSIDKHGVGSSKDQAPRPRTNLAYLISLPMALHLAVLAFYIALCVVRVTGVEQNIQVALASASHTQTLINLISHLIMLAFSTAIIALMQPIATRSPFGNLPQPLTAVSDKISSWSGLGSSLLNLYHNVVFPATLGNALFTALYFSTLSGLGISSSFLFNVPAVNETITRNMMTRVGSPSISGLVPPGCDILSNVSTLTFEWYRSGMGIGMLTSDNTSVYPGLSANRIYDTLLSPMAASSNSSAEVGYTDFHVKCGSVPKVSISATNIDSFDTTPYYVRYHDNANSSASKFDANYHALLSVNYTLGNAPMELSDGLSISITNASRAVSRLWRPSDVLLRVPDSNLVAGFGRNVVLYNIYNQTGLVSGSQPLLDSDNLMGSPWPLRLETKGTTNGTSLMVQVIGCSLSTSAGRATIDATTNRLISTPSSLQGASAHSTWAEWNPDLKNSSALEDTWASMFLPTIGSPGLWDSSPIPLWQTTLWSCFSMQAKAELVNDTLTETQTWSALQLQKMYDHCHIPTVVEEYLTTRLFGAVTGHDDTGDAVRDSSSGNATLGALESALADATAMAMWSAARANTLTVTCPIQETANVFDEMDVGEFVMPLSTVLAPVNGSASVVEQVLIGRITFNDPSLILGAIFSAVLTVLGAYILVRGDVARIEHAPIKDAGLLSLMALDNSAIAPRLSASSMDSVKMRRRAGDFLVRIVDGQLVPVEDID